MTMLGSLLAAAALAAAPGWSEIPSESPDTTATALAPPAATFRLWVQAGAWLALGDRPAGDPGSDNVMLTWEVSGFRWDGRSATWGLGVRTALDDLGFRAGPKALVRFPVGDGGGGAYFQVAGSWYLFKGDSDLADDPGWCLEAEIAPAGPFAFAIGLESLRSMVYNHGTVWDPYPQTTWSTTSATTGYAGLKFAQWTGVALTAVLFAAAAATVAGSGW